MPTTSTKYSATKARATAKHQQAGASSWRKPDEGNTIREVVTENLRNMFADLAGRGQSVNMREIIGGYEVTINPARKQSIRKPETAKRRFDPEEAGRQIVAEMQRAEGGAWTGAELAAHYGLTSAALHKRRIEHRIVWWKDARSRFHYPRWQFDSAGAPLPGVQDVLQTFESADPWRVMRYFLVPRHQLGNRTPLDLLRAGDFQTVAAHAKLHGEENTW